MINKLVVSLSTAALMILSAAQSHTVTLFQESIVNGKALKPGDYRVMVDHNKVIIGSGKNKVEATVTVETAGTKFNSTSVRYENGDGKYRLKEIRLGGTSTKLVFN